jgi:hypothetical protein
MQNQLAKQLSDAVNQGQLVVISAPLTRPGSEASTPSPRDRSETELAVVLCLVFNLRRSEGRILAKLLANDCVSQEDLHDRDNPTVAISTMSAAICVLRKKLRLHDIDITTVVGLGYGLGQESRDKIRSALSQYDDGLIPLPPQRARERA